MNETRMRKNGTGSWRSDRRVGGMDVRSMRVPWMIEWIERRKERRRKAGVERVARVRGRTRRIWRAEESLLCV